MDLTSNEISAPDQASNGIDGPPGKGSLVVLLVEDNPADARLIREYLARQEGSLYRIEWVQRLSEALDRLSRGGVEVVLVDLNLPDSVGLDTFRAVHARAGGAPVLPVTGLDDERLALEIVKMGAQDYLVKGKIDEKLLSKSIRFAVERSRAEESLREREEKFRIITSTAHDAIIIMDSKGRTTYWNAAAEAIFGYSREEALGVPAHELLAPGGEETDIMGALNNYEATKEIGIVGRTFDASARRKDGTQFPAEVSVSAVQLRGEWNYIGIVRDISERILAEEAIEKLAYYDALTGLPNRVLFTDRLALALSLAERHRRKLGVMMLDLDGFKDVNDSLGHRVGDVLLQAVSSRLSHRMRKSDTVARLGGDEFMVLLPEIIGDDDVASIADKINQSFQEAFTVEGHEIRVTASIGVTIYPEDGENADRLMGNADIAMYDA
ncbi:MAG: diguanylate cyclase, partial [Dehalococcoidia bacterium]|nr:diguanylate cyclase [Dehalococcoidia bacterium]